MDLLLKDSLMVPIIIWVLSRAYASIQYQETFIAPPPFLFLERFQRITSAHLTDV